MGFRIVDGRRDMATPVAQRTEDGVFVAHSGDAWLYGILPNDALQWEDNEVRQAVALRFMTLFTEIGLHSRLSPPGVRHVKRNEGHLREIHLQRISQDVPPNPPRNNPRDIAEWQRNMFAQTQVRFNRGLIAFGIKLRRSNVVSRKGTKALFSEFTDSVLGQDIDLAPYNTDRNLMHGILKKAGAHIPTREEANLMEFWWNGGRGADATLTPTPDGKFLGCSAWGEGLEFASLIDFDKAQLDPRQGLWLNDVFSVNEGCVCVSVRAEVYPAAGVNSLFRKTRRKARTQMEENEATGDVDRGEDQELADAARVLEDYFRQSGEPVLRNVSIIFARQASEASHTYRDHLQQHWGLEVKVLEHRQHLAFQETLPCGPTKFRVEKPFSQDISIGAIATSGVTSFSDIGDKEGIWLGTALSDMTPIWVDPGGASKANTPPAMAVVGESGSGKTFLLQLLATQCAIAGFPVVFINPKPSDSLDGFCAAVGGETISMSNTVHNPGALDPFRFARTHADAAQIAASHIKSVLLLEHREELRLDSGMKRAVDAGAACAGEALQDELISDETRENIMLLCEGQPLFAQGISMTPRPKMGLINSETLGAGRGSLTLVEFDRQLSLPSSMDSSSHSQDERVAMASVRLVCNAALESMFAAGGGVLILDEAHVMMGSQEGRKIITRLGREGRSQRILPVLATQLLADIMEGDANMVSHLSRVCVLKMRDPREARAALQLLRLEATEDRLDWLTNAGPIRGERGSLGFFRDLNERVSGFTVGPVPKSLEMLFSTNPLDKDERGAVSRFNTEATV